MTCHSFLKDGKGLGSTTLSLSKDVTLRLGGGLNDKSDIITLYDVLFSDGVPNFLLQM